MLRLSSYAILSDQMQHGGYALLSGLTGAVDVIDDTLCETLREKLRHGDPRAVFFQRGELPAAIEDHWKSRGYLSDISHEEEKERIRALAGILHDHVSEKRSVVVVPDMGCNYRCPYCFEKPLQADEHAKTAMSESEAEQLFQAIDQMGGTNYERKSISLFGGEPLIADNRDIVFKIVNLGAERGYQFNAVTNGHDLDAFLPLLAEGKITEIQITMDGPKRIHDKRRVTIDGSSSYDKLMANMEKVMAGTGAKIVVRANMDESNMDAFGELLDAFDARGWMDDNRFAVNAAVIYQEDKHGAVSPVRDATTVAHRLREQSARFRNVLIGSSQSLHGDMVYSALTENRPYSLRSNYCAAASGMYVFTPGGRIYCCWVSVGKECSEIGSYSSEGMSIDPEKSARWFGRNAALLPECLECKYCLVCAGGCPQYAEYNSGTVLAPFCDGFQETYPWVLAEYVEKYLAEARAEIDALE